MIKRRVTVMLDDEILEKLRKRQIDKMIKESRSVSLSEVINEFARKGMKR